MLKKISSGLGVTLYSVFLVSCSNGLHPGENFFPTNGAEILLNNDKGEWTLYIDRKDVSKIVGLRVTTNENLGNVWIEVAQLEAQNTALPSNFTIQWTPAGLTCKECTGGLRTWMRKVGH
jgi:hypothetical protein